MQLWCVQIALIHDLLTGNPQDEFHAIMLWAGEVGVSVWILPILMSALEEELEAQRVG